MARRRGRAPGSGRPVRPAIPEVLGVGEDRSSVPQRRGTGHPSPSDVLSVYLEGGPRYRLGSRTYGFRPPAAILIPEGVVDDDLQEGRVSGVFALFRGHGLLEAAGGRRGTEVAMTLDGERRAVPCLKELGPEGARSLAATLVKIASVRGAALAGRLRRAALLIGAISDYCEAGAESEGGGVHRAAAQLQDFIDELAFENIPLERIYERLDVSSAHAETLFRRAFGVTPVAYRRRLRLGRARELLVSSQMNVSEAAYAVGFADPLYFSRVFRRVFGTTPSSLIREFSHRRKLAP